MAAQLQGCVPTWKATAPLAPADVVKGWRPDRARVQLADGTTTTIANPRVRDDALLGDTAAGPERVEVTIPLSAIEGLEVRHRPRLAERAAAGFPIVSGEELKVWSRDGGGERRVQGRFVALRNDSLVLAFADGTQTAIPVSEITRAQVQIGTTSNLGTGALIGLVGAAVILGIGGIAAAATEDDPYGSGAFGESAIVLYSAGAIAGVVLILGITGGAISRRDAWETVPLSAFAAAARNAGPSER